MKISSNNYSYAVYKHVEWKKEKKKPPDNTIHREHTQNELSAIT